MKTQNTNNQTTTTNNDKSKLTNVQTNVIYNLANVVKEATKDVDNYDLERLTTALKAFADFKKELSDNGMKLEANKIFWCNFDNLTTARIKNVTKVRTDKTTATSETAKATSNTLFKSVEEQKKGVRSMLANALNRGKFEMNFSKKQYLETFDTLNDNEFCGLYKGANLVRLENVVKMLTSKLIEATK